MDDETLAEDRITGIEEIKGFNYLHQEVPSKIVGNNPAGDRIFDEIILYRFATYLAGISSRSRFFVFH